MIKHLTMPAGAAGEEIIPSADSTLYAQWVDLKLESADNYKANGGKGAVDLSWSQTDQKNKTYLLFQKKENGTWTRINSAEDISSMTQVAITENYSGSAEEYTIPYTGLYTLTAEGAQGQDFESCHRRIRWARVRNLLAAKGREDHMFSGRTGWR